MRFVINMTVGDNQDGAVLVEWLAFHLIDETRSDIMRALKVGRVAIDRVPVSDPQTRLRAGTEIGYQEGGDDPDTASPWSRGAGTLGRG